MKKYADRRQEQHLPAPRRRSQDVVIWEEGDGSLYGREWVVYDSATDQMYRFEEEAEALRKFKQIKQDNAEAELL